ncbi:O-antigen ligase family protein [Baekduia sp.]|uniref:O-antigen ligase family protein n=1 Tax=Baekduia sp. TaxID=2600305 RepID=UPI002E0C46E8|nr:O-antigen ligase family protein [Baekduia sp.]
MRLVALDPARSQRVSDASLVLAPFGVALGVSAGWESFYDVTLWGPLAIVAAVVLVAAIVLRSEPLPRAGRVLVVGLGAFAAWSLASGWWAESSASAAVEGQRWALYAMVVGLVAVLARSERERTVVLVGMTVGGLLAVAVLVVHLLGDHGVDEFFARRLSYPVGYINGQAAAFGLLVWPCVAWGERGRVAVLRGAGAAGACLLLGLLLLTQSRGAVLALVGTLVVVLVLVPGRLRRAWLLVVIGAGVAAVAAPLLDLYGAAPITTPPSSGEIRDALIPLLLAAAVVGLVWGGLTSAILRPRWERPTVQRAGAAILCAGALIGLIGGVAVVGNPVDRIDHAADQFTSLDTNYAPGDSRLLSGSGNRYDYWRVAVDAFKHHPLDGVGAGNYPRSWFQLRQSQENVRQPHSLWFQTAAETGIVGLLLILAALGAAAVGVGRAAWVAQSERQRLLAVAGLGAFTWWLLQTSVDWLHLLPGLTCVALVSAVIVLPRRESAAPDPATVSSRPLAITAAVVVVVCFAAAGVGRTTLATFLLKDARNALPQDPQKAIDRSQAALGLRPGDVDALVVEAAASARAGDYRAARGALLEATALEPHNFLPYVLLGDLATRRGDTEAARSAYARAAALNPLDPTIRRSLLAARHG